MPSKSRPPRRRRAAPAGRRRSAAGGADHKFDFVAIGSGPAGQRAAVQAAKLGYKAAIVERNPTVGGVCIETGTIPSKTLREAVLSYLSAERFIARRGEALERPTGGALASRVADVVRKETAVIADQLERNEVAVLNGEARFESPRRLIVRSAAGESRVEAADVLIAVGSEPAPAPEVAGGEGLVVTSDRILTLARLPRTLTVVGAGVIGVEYASILAALDVEVTLVDRRERLLEFLDTEIVDELVHQLRNRNVSFRLGEKVARLSVTGGSRRRAVVSLESGKRLVSDLLLYAAGRQGATARLDLAAAGLEADERGRIAVDADFRTAVPHVYAAGDVIGYPSLAATSSEQGRIAACRALGAAVEPMAAHFPVGLYAIPEVSMSGATERALTASKVPYEVGVARYRETARGQILGDDSGFLKMLFHRESRKLLGVHVVGTGATELVHVGQAVLGLGGGLDYFLGTVFNYPTLAECYKVAALDAHNKLNA